MADSERGNGEYQAGPGRNKQPQRCRQHTDDRNQHPTGRHFVRQTRNVIDADGGAGPRNGGDQRLLKAEGGAISEATCEGRKNISP